MCFGVLVTRTRLVRWVTPERAESVLLMVAGLAGWLVWKAGAPKWAGLVLSLGVALLVRWMRQRGHIERALVRWLHRHEEPSGV
jgi:hypothetical protein